MVLILILPEIRVPESWVEPGGSLGNPKVYPGLGTVSLYSLCPEFPLQTIPQTWNPVRRGFPEHTPGHHICLTGVCWPWAGHPSAPPLLLQEHQDVETGPGFSCRGLWRWEASQGNLEGRQGGVALKWVEFTRPAGTCRSPLMTGCLRNQHLQCAESE